MATAQNEKSPMNFKQKQRVKVIHTTLDDVPFGSDEDLPKPGSKLEKMSLPDGLTHKQLYKDVLMIAWPSFLELVLTQLTGMADQIMVGRLPGEIGVQALSAVGLSTQPKFLLMTMVQALNVGATAMVARARGRNDREQANQVFRQSVIFNVLLSAIMMALGIIFTVPLLKLIGGSGISDSTYAYAADYFRIQMMGFVPLCITFTFTAVLRGTGETRIPLVYNTMANIINVVFNYLLIYGKLGLPRMEVLGASLATVIGQTSAFIFAMIIVLDKRRYLHLDLKEKFRYDPDIMKNVIKIGIPSMVEQLFMRAGMMLFTRTITGLGDVAYATHNICMNIQAMSFMTGQAFANSATTLMGQSLGKKRLDMAENYTRHTKTVGTISAIVLAVLFALFGKYVVALYNNTPEVVDIGGKILFFVAFMQPFQAGQFITAGALRGAGDTRFPALAIAITVLGVRASFAFILVTLMHFGLWGAWIALVCDQLIRSWLIGWHYRKGKWRFIRLSAKKA